ncbi:MAG: B12-binding domain-containing radical SAM protein [Magnetospirillum sp. WYHS-4]
MNFARKQGFHDISLYDIDCLRPSFEDAVAEILRRKPDVLGISAVVSTAYAYTRKLSRAVKEALPDTLIVVGGNMAASAEILLRRTGIDLCVTGEGEAVFANLLARARATRDLRDFRDVGGLVLLNGDGDLVNTGYEPALRPEELYDIDWSDLEMGSRIEHFFPKVADNVTLLSETFHYDGRLFEAHRLEKTYGFLYTAKGCVSRCTFCHRWDKGLRRIPLDIVMARLEEMIRRYNLGFLNIADEMFGADKKKLLEFCERIKPYDIMWTASTRVTGITADLMRTIVDAGCANLNYGTESGSERILQVMEKKTSVAQNREAIRLSYEFGAVAPIALVIGMPGEDRETIRETIELCKFAKTLDKRINPNNLSINYAQALPGTPLYEYGRRKGLIGQDLDGEEGYLLAISDRDAHDEFATLNFTDYPTLETQTWRPLITVEVNQHFVRTFGIDQYLRVVLADLDLEGTAGSDSGYYANPKRLIEQARSSAPVAKEGDDLPAPRPPSLWRLVRSGRWGLALVCHPVLAYRLRRFLLGLVFLKNIRKFGWSYSLGLLQEYLAFHFAFRRRPATPPARSLRKMVEEDMGALPGDAPAMAPLRKGR